MEKLILKRDLRNFFLAVLLLFVMVSEASAHHVLGRPAYSLNEDSNTPPAMQIEAQIGDYFVTMMLFPAFPKPGVPARINLYATHLDDESPYDGTVTFTIRDDVMFGSSHSDSLGVQRPDDNVFRQGFVVPHNGEYIITAKFEAGGQPYLIDFPMLIGPPNNLTPLVLSAVVILLIIGGLALRRKKRRDQIIAGSTDKK